MISKIRHEWPVFLAGVGWESLLMNNTASSPLIVPLLCVLRCLVPVLILFGISYLLRRFGFITEPPPEPKEELNENNHSEKGDLVHGSV